MCCYIASLYFLADLMCESLLTVRSQPKNQPRLLQFLLSPMFLKCKDISWKHRLTRRSSWKHIFVVVIPAVYSANLFWRNSRTIFLVAYNFRAFTVLFIGKYAAYIQALKVNTKQGEAVFNHNIKIFQFAFCFTGLFHRTRSKIFSFSSGSF